MEEREEEYCLFPGDVKFFLLLNLYKTRIFEYQRCRKMFINYFWILMFCTKEVESATRGRAFWNLLACSTLFVWVGKEVPVPV